MRNIHLTTSKMTKSLKNVGDGSFAELVVITDVVQEGSFQDAITILGGMSMVKEISSVVRVYA